MKKLSIVVLLVGFGLAATAQSNPRKDNYPYWTISKDVAKLQFKNVEYLPAKILVGDPAWTIAKIYTPASAKTSRGKVVTSGYPTWMISKGAARHQMERANR
jgi:hypothetical protein